jgi:chromosomal replication initiation ATPase DnaA
MPMMFTAGGSGSGKSHILKTRAAKEGYSLDQKYADNDSTKPQYCEGIKDEALD